MWFTRPTRHRLQAKQCMHASRSSLAQQAGLTKHSTQDELDCSMQDWLNTACMTSQIQHAGLAKHCMQDQPKTYRTRKKQRGRPYTYSMHDRPNKTSRQLCTTCSTSHIQDAGPAKHSKQVKDQPNAAYGTVQPKAVYRTSHAHAKSCSRTQHAWPTSYNMQDQPIAILGLKKTAMTIFS
jgi:hypothetical protein